MPRRRRIVIAFQSTRPRGARLEANIGRIPSAPVSIHAPTRGATCTNSSGFSWPPKFQSTRPRGARLGEQGRIGRDRLVSIHAPTRGATLSMGAPLSTSIVSIHAPTRGATLRLRLGGRRRTCFNPRAHAGRDASFAATPAPRAPFQSTRPRGARPRACSRCSTSEGCFNPRAHAGRDPPAPPSAPPSILFQSTRPRGARQQAADAVDGVSDVSIHAPTRGATFSYASWRACSIGFNPRAHAGRDVAGDGVVLVFAVVSIHAPTRGATFEGHNCILVMTEFQSTRPRGARLDRASE